MEGPGGGGSGSGAGGRKRLTGDNDEGGAAGGSPMELEWSGTAPKRAREEEEVR